MSLCNVQEKHFIKNNSKCHRLVNLQEHDPSANNQKRYLMRCNVPFDFCDLAMLRSLCNSFLANLSFFCSFLLANKSTLGSSVRILLNQIQTVPFDILKLSIGWKAHSLLTMKTSSSFSYYTSEYTDQHYPEPLGTTPVCHHQLSYTPTWASTPENMQ